MSDSFLISRKLSFWDKATITLYIILSSWVWIHFERTNSAKSQSDTLFTYVLGTHLFLYFLNYRSLRNLTVYVFWIIIGSIHLFFYFKLKDDQVLANVRGHSATGLRNTIILLVLFQVLRFASIRLQGKELVAPSRGRTDLFDERPVTFVDFILFVCYIAATILLLFN